MLKPTKIKNLIIGQRVMITAPNYLIGRSGTIVKPEPQKAGDRRMYFLVNVDYGNVSREVVIATEYLESEAQNLTAS